MLWFYLLQVLLFALRWPNSIRLERLTLDFTSFQLPGRSDCWATDGLLTLLCTPALVLLSVLTGRVSTSRTVNIIWTIWAIQSLEQIRLLRASVSARLGNRPLVLDGSDWTDMALILSLASFGGA